MFDVNWYIWHHTLVLEIATAYGLAMTDLEVQSKTDPHPILYLISHISPPPGVFLPPNLSTASVDN